MININYNIYLFCILLLIGSCAEHNELANKNIIEGEPAIIKLNLDVATSTVLTRALSSPEAEKKVSNLFIFILDNDENISSSHYFGIITESFEIETVSGNGKTIYGIANVNSVLKKELEKTNTLSDLLDIQYTLPQNIVDQRSNFLMSGTMELDIHVGDNGDVGSISLIRLDAKVTFNITTPTDLQTVNGKTISNIEFISDSWRIFNCSTKANIIHSTEESSSTYSLSELYFDSEIDEFDVQTGNDVNTHRFSFYILPSLLKPKKLIPSNTTKAEGYSLRTKREKNIPSSPTESKNLVKNGDFIYADKNSPYVVFSGTLSYTQDGIKHIAKVTYTILLGYANEDYNDYKTKANTNYTYNVSLISANSIVVEANSNSIEDESHSGVEGSVSNSANSYEFDAHFDTQVITFNSSNAVGVLGWYISTPFEQGKYSPTEKENRPRDYKWIYFLLNDTKNNSQYLDSYAKYPGSDAIYNYNDIWNTQIGDEETKKHNIALITDYLQYGKDKLIDIQHLAKILSASQETIGSTLYLETEIKFTAFINEYYYDKHPISGNEDPLLWKQFVNYGDRSIGLSSSTKISPDGQSEYISATIEFTQNAIQTIFNVNSPDLKSAWGTENKDNIIGGVGYNSRLTIPTTSKHDGHNNALIWLGLTNNTEPKWVDYVNSENNTLKNNSSRHACLLQNRDINADGIINADEVHWYLAAIDQLLDSWIGENSLPAGSRLYRYRKAGDNGTIPSGTPDSPWGEELYISSSMHPAAEEKHYSVMWSSEGSSVSSSQNNGDWMRATKFYYRCLRNLGEGAADNIATLKFNDSNTDPIYKISLKNLDQESIRKYKITNSAFLTAHHERSEHNLPYHSFLVRKPSNISNHNYNWAGVFGTQGTELICPSGWRFPNQRELALIASRIPGSGWTKNDKHDYIASTSFSLSNNRPGFSINDASKVSNSISAAKIRLLSNSDKNCSARCVQDAEL